jgi:transcriptional repressor NrdR
MLCPYCRSPDTKVTDKRDSGEVTRRRRECLKCAKRFTTFERVESSPIVVVKKDGSREQFNRDKLYAGILRACEKRPIPAERIMEIAADVESRLRGMTETEIPTATIGTLVMKHLRKLDKVAYIRFASVYREFTDLESFEEELRKLLKK